MTNIKINCSFCGERNCQIKKDFRQLSEKYDLHPFELKCGYKKPKYENGKRVTFTVAHGFERFNKIWKCTEQYGRKYDDCNGCSLGNRDMCDDGEVTFINRRHTKTETISGIVFGYIGNGKYIIIAENSEYKRINGVIAEKEMEVLENIHNKIAESNSGTYITGYNTFDSEFYFVTKSKYIKLQKPKTT